LLNIATFSCLRKMIGAALIFASFLACAELSQHESEVFNNEPPVIKNLLRQAALLERGEPSVENDWQAARLYCAASRFGSAEGQFRLGMLYAAGKGVPVDGELAAAMFVIASQQGHHAAQQMLNTVKLKALDLPPCVTAEVEPEKAPPMVPPVVEIDRYVANLPADKRWLLDLVATISGWYKVDPKLVLSIISVESNFAVGAQSAKQAQGLMQLIPETAERFNVKNAFNASQNIRGGVAYLRWLLAYFEGDVALAVAAYNAGEGAVNKYEGIPPFAETRRYVKEVQQRYPIKYHPFDVKITEPSPVIKRRG